MIVKKITKDQYENDMSSLRRDNVADELITDIIEIHYVRIFHVSSIYPLVPLVHIIGYGHYAIIMDDIDSCEKFIDFIKTHDVNIIRDTILLRAL